MPLTYKAKGGGGDFVSVPSGSHIAVCNLVADLGIQPGSQAFPAAKPQVYIRFEIPAERIEFERDGRKIDGPAIIGQAFTASMHEKATLRHRLEGWRGKKFSDTEAENFDVSAILGKGCMLTIVENVKDGKVYSNIAGIGALPKGLTVGSPENEPLFYASFDTRSYSKLPEWIRKKIDTQIVEKVIQRSEQPLDDGTFIDDSDIPF